MRTKFDFRPVAYLFIIAGTILAVLSAIVPHYGAGHRLAFDVLVVGILPYAVYGALTEVLRGWSLLLPGALMVPIHAWLTLSERHLGFDEYTSGFIYAVPIAMTVVVLPLTVLAGRFLNDERPARQVAAVPSASKGLEAEKET